MKKQQRDKDGHSLLAAKQGWGVTFRLAFLRCVPPTIMAACSVATCILLDVPIPLLRP